MAFGLLGGASLLGVGGTLGALLNGTKKTQTQVPLEPPEITAARKSLSDYANTGVFGTGDNQIVAGQDLGLPLGNYDINSTERSALSNLEQIINASLPSSLTSANDTLNNFLNDTSIDPAGQFAPFKTAVERELRDRTNELKRSAAFAGNLFSRDTIQNLGDVQARGQEQLTSALAELTNQALNRRLSAAQAAPGVAGAIDTLNSNRIRDALSLGGYERNLSNVGAEVQRNELLRQRDEQLGRINALQAVLGSTPQYGVPSIDYTEPSPFQNFLNIVAQIGGKAVGNALIPGAA